MIINVKKNAWMNEYMQKDIVALKELKKVMDNKKIKKKI
jgi:hypothetical protein